MDAWLQDLETAMRTTLHSHIEEALSQYPTDNISFLFGGNWEEWVPNWEGQVVLAVSQVMWTAAVTKALSVTGNIT